MRSQVPLKVHDDRYLEGAYKSPCPSSTFQHIPLPILYEAALWTVDDLIHQLIFPLKGTKDPIKTGLNYKDIKYLIGDMWRWDILFQLCFCSSMLTSPS